MKKDRFLNNQSIWTATLIKLNISISLYYTKIWIFSHMLRALPVNNKSVLPYYSPLPNHSPSISKPRAKARGSRVFISPPLAIFSPEILIKERLGNEKMETNHTTSSSSRKSSEPNEARYLQFHQLPDDKSRDGKPRLNRYSSTITKEHDFPGAKVRLQMLSGQQELRAFPLLRMIYRALMD